MDNYALIPDGSNEVYNIIVADGNFYLEGFYLIKINDGVYCQAGMFYNKNDGLFYDDEDYSRINSLDV